ncbi:MAG: F0F1 ATP synthase subunit delta [Desulfobulbales bacterium]
MLIDWFTVGAQIVNFLILIYLLKRFLYKPILRAMDEREQKIAGRLREAAAQREKAEAESEALALERWELENNKKRMQAEIKAEIEDWRDKAMEKAKSEVEKTRSSWQESFESEKDDFIRKMKTVLSRQVFSVAAKVMEDLADERLEAKLVEKFNKKLPEVLGKNEESVQNMGRQLQVKSGFELNTDQQQDIQAVIAEIFPEAEVMFQVDPEIGFGVRLTGNNRKIEWSLSRYMDEMEEKILNTMHLAKSEKT